MTKQALLLIAAVCLVLLTDVFRRRTNTPNNPAGFFWGMAWMVSLNIVIVHFFNNEIRIYEINTSGWLWRFGFYIAIINL